MTNLTKGVSPSKNYPGKIIVFYSANNNLQNYYISEISFLLNLSIFITIVAYKAPED